MQIFIFIPALPCIVSVAHIREQISHIQAVSYKTASFRRHCLSPLPHNFPIGQIIQRIRISHIRINTACFSSQRILHRLTFSLPALLLHKQSIRFSAFGRNIYGKIIFLKRIRRSSSLFRIHLFHTFFGFLKKESHIFRQFFRFFLCQIILNRPGCRLTVGTSIRIAIRNADAVPCFRDFLSIPIIDCAGKLLVPASMRTQRPQQIPRKPFSERIIGP